jgi:hypothetical protein
MSEDIILSECWAEYDRYKQKKAENPQSFNPSDRFEVNFLAEKILIHYSQYTDLAIMLSIDQAKRLMFKDCGRAIFVKLVLANLIRREPFLQ